MQNIPLTKKQNSGKLLDISKKVSGTSSDKKSVKTPSSKTVVRRTSSLNKSSVEKKKEEQRPGKPSREQSKVGTPAMSKTSTRSMERKPSVPTFRRDSVAVTAKGKQEQQQQQQQPAESPLKNA